MEAQEAVQHAGCLYTPCAQFVLQLCSQVHDASNCSKHILLSEMLCIATPCHAASACSQISESDELLISDICSRLDVDGLRGDIVINRAAKALVAFEGRSKVETVDIARIITACLNHRLRKDPLDPIDNGTKVAVLFRRLTDPEFVKREEEAKKKAEAAAAEAAASGKTDRAGKKAGAWGGLPGIGGRVLLALAVPPVVGASRIFVTKKTGSDCNRISWSLKRNHYRMPLGNMRLTEQWPSEKAEAEAEAEAEGADS
eukprot:59710-Chlamydomonas_euryale.AAC.3